MKNFKYIKHGGLNPELEWEWLKSSAPEKSSGSGLRAISLQNKSFQFSGAIL